ncbi:hypothetical protein KR222_003576, partial [Zaprionus bogoriensis]
IPIRGIVAIMSFLALITAYTNRVSISHVITMLVVPQNRTGNTEEVCPKEEVEESKEGYNKPGQYKWSEQLQGFVLSSFYIGYIITHLPGGILADKYGAKWVLGICLGISALCTMFSPLAIEHGQEIGLICIRIIMGAAQGPLFPALTALLSAWVPKSERGTLGAFVYSGVTAGTVLSNLGSGFMLHEWHWSITLLVFGGVAFMWFILFILLCTSKPDNHPCIMPKELGYLKDEIGTADVSKAKIPWKDMMCSRVMWAVVASQLGHDWGYFVMITCLPKYMADVLQFSIRSNGFVTALPFVAMFICTNLSGLLADYLIRTEKLSVDLQRKIFTFIGKYHLLNQLAITLLLPIGAAGPGIFTVAASYAGCEKILVVALFTIAMFTMGFYYAGQKLSPMDMSPSYAGTIMAVTNGLGALAGVFSPIVVGALTPNATMQEWRVVFWLGLIILVLSAVWFWIWGSAEVQPYD